MSTPTTNNTKEKEYKDYVHRLLVLIDWLSNNGPSAGMMETCSIHNGFSSTEECRICKELKQIKESCK